MTPNTLPVILSGPKFDPRKIANLEWWIDASDVTTVYDTAGQNANLTATGACGRIQDKSNFGHDVEAVASTKPTWTTALQNGKAGLDCTNGGYFDTLAANVTLGSSVTAFFVATFIGNNASNTFFDGDGGSMLFRSSTRLLDIVLSGVVDIGAATTAASSTLPSINVGSYDATNGAVYSLNGAANGTQAANGTASGLTKTFLGPTFAFSGYLFEMLVYKRILAVGEIAYLVTGLNRKWRDF